jgi:RNA polymerase sigma-70 factor (ECF subfamily)
MYEAAADCRSIAPTAFGPSAARASCLGSAAARQVLDALYRRERAALLSYLRRHVGAEAAGDLAQDVFLRAATSPQLLHLANPGGFLHRIARNLLIDRARRRSGEMVLLSLMEDKDAFDSAEPECELIAGELGVLLAQALKRLPNKTRRVFEMSRFENKTYREIHRELGISLAAVEYHMMKALARLRAVVESSGWDRPPTTENNFT